MNKKELLLAVTEYLEIVNQVFSDYTDITTVAELRASRPELDFMDDDEIEDILKYAKLKRR